MATYGMNSMIQIIRSLNSTGSILFKNTECKRQYPMISADWYYTYIGIPQKMLSLSYGKQDLFFPWKVALSLSNRNLSYLFNSPEYQPVRKPEICLCVPRAHSKFSKTFNTFFFPVGEDVREIVSEWVSYLRTMEKGLNIKGC